MNDASPPRGYPSPKYSATSISAPLRAASPGICCGDTGLSQNAPC